METRKGVKRIEYELCKARRVMKRESESNIHDVRRKTQARCKKRNGWISRRRSRIERRY